MAVANRRIPVQVKPLAPLVGGLLRDGRRRHAALAWLSQMAIWLLLVPACTDRSASREVPVPDGMVRVPAGDYPVGSGAPREGPRRTVRLEAFFIDRYPVEESRYRTWIQDNEPAFDTWIGRLAESERAGRPGYPATNVTYDEAEAYCAARGKRLPIEYEYEAAARGTDGRVFPWGSDWQPGMVDENAFGPAPIGRFPGAASPFGAEDMTGNVFHWTRSTVRLSAFQAPERTDPVVRVIKAGGWPCARAFNRATFRAAMNASFHSPWVGFRCVQPVDPDHDTNLKLEALHEPYTDRVFDTTEGLRQLFSYELLPGRRLHPEMAAHVAKIAKGSTVADVGAGIGYLSFTLSRAVGGTGTVYAVDIDKSVLEFIDACHAFTPNDNIRTIHSKPDDAMLPEGSCDVVYLLGTVHCLSQETWRPFMESCRKALKPGGLLVVQDNTSHPVVGTVAGGMAKAGFELVEHAGALLPAETGRTEEHPPAPVTDLRQQPAQGYLFRIYRKR